MAKSSRRPPAGDSRDSTPSESQPPSSAPSSSGSQYDRDRVAERAYELYRARGGSDGADMEDWLAAEREFSSDSDSEPHDE
jgi:hypothetical protein